MARLAVVLVLAHLAFGCDDEAPADPPGRDPSEPYCSDPPDDQPTDDEPAGPDSNDQVIAPSFSEAELDAMDTPALEAACFEGATAACDRLGH